MRLGAWMGHCAPLLLAFTSSMGPANAGPLTAQSGATVQWAPEVFSPHLGIAATNQDEPLRQICGDADVALAQVAAQNAEHQLRTGHPLEADELAFHLRTAGAPYMWPRAWSIKGATLDDTDLAKRVTAWTKGGGMLGQRRCGVARQTIDGVTVVSAIAIDALADLEALPINARVGQWLSLKGALLVPADSVHVVLLGPRGAPRKVLASLDGQTIRSTFSLDQPGTWLVQVLADTVVAGPRPVLQTTLFAGEQPPGQFVRVAAPGEQARLKHTDETEAMAAMMNAARATESLGPLRRDPALDGVARAHSEAMLTKGLVAHDIGTGGPMDRLHAASVRLRLAGENVASAGTLVKAHRAIWSSPSHRGNLLDRRFSRMGLAVISDPSGRVWVTQMFAD